MAQACICDACDAPGTAWCQRCKVVAYCGKEHQSKAWPWHRVFCKTIRNSVSGLRLSRTAGSVTYEGRGVLPARSTVWTQKSLLFMMNPAVQRMYEAKGLVEELKTLETVHVQSVASDERLTNTINACVFLCNMFKWDGGSINYVFGQFPATVYAPDAVNINETIRCLSTIQSAIRTQSGDALGSGVEEPTLRNLVMLVSTYVRPVTSNVLAATIGFSLDHMASYLPHSCDPNVALYRLGNEVAAVALRDIAPGERLTHSFLPNIRLMSLPIRTELISNLTGRACKCTLCTAGDETPLARMDAELEAGFEPEFVAKVNDAKELGAIVQRIRAVQEPERRAWVARRLIERMTVHYFERPTAIDIKHLLPELQLLDTPAAYVEWNWGMNMLCARAVLLVSIMHFTSEGPEVDGAFESMIRLCRDDVDRVFPGRVNDFFFLDFCTMRTIIDGIQPELRLSHQK